MALLTYATRRSALALAQCRALVVHLCATEPSLETRELLVVTTGDRVQDRPLADVGGKGLFVKEIEEALLEKRADFAVHSMKDVPGEIASGLVIACIPKREDPRDVLVSPRYRTLDALPRGARVGTSSLRRAIALSQHRPDLVIEPLRGNVDTRLRKVDAGQCDAIVLARAGLLRLGLEDRATQILEPDTSLPAAGQGALAIECREADEGVRTLLSRLHDPETGVCVAAERGVLAAVGGDCRTPLGAFAEHAGDHLRLRALLASGHPGSRSSGVRYSDRATDWPESEAHAEAFGRSVGTALRVGVNP
ncbi:MAG: hydroxymethylbilane synthase [Polyangiaceae bacterium]